MEYRMWNNVKNRMPKKAGYYLVVVMKEVASKLRGCVEISDCYTIPDLNTMTENLKFQDYVTHWMPLPKAPTDADINSTNQKSLGKYFISNLDGQIHNANDCKHSIIEHSDWTEIIIFDSDGCEVDRCNLYTSLDDLLWNIS